MQIHKYRKLHEKSMITIFSYMEIVWLAFFHNPKLLVFLISENLLVVFVTEHKRQKPWLLKHRVSKGLNVLH